MKICIFEDTLSAQFYPLTLTRPVYFLRCGVSEFHERIAETFPASEIAYHCREYIAEVTAERTGGPVNRFDNDSYLLINGRCFADDSFVSAIDPGEPDVLYESEGEIAAAALSPDSVKRLGSAQSNGIDLRKSFPDFPVRQTAVTLFSYLWEVLSYNSLALSADFEKKYTNMSGTRGLCDENHCINPQNVYIGSGVVIKPGVVLDAGGGPVMIDDGVTVEPNAVLSGPVYVGKHGRINAGARIGGGTSLGPVCRIGGEVSASIVQGYGNKQHDGYLGNAFLGEWVNIGAGTNNSDLKNNYKPVTVTVNGTDVDTGRTHVGLFMGDHGKTAIGTQLNTGTVVGAFCNVFGSGLIGKNIPSFTWGGGKNLTEYDRDRAIETAAAVMARRNVELSKSTRRLYSQVYGSTAESRNYLPGSS